MTRSAHSFCARGVRSHEHRLLAEIGSITPHREEGVNTLCYVKRRPETVYYTMKKVQRRRTWISRIV